MVSSVITAEVLMYINTLQMSAKICKLNVSCTCSLLVKYTMYESVETWKGYIYAILMFLTAVANSLLMQTMFKLSFDIGGRTKSGILSMVYKKVRTIEMHSNVLWRCQNHLQMSAINDSFLLCSSN